MDDCIGNPNRIIFGTSQLLRVVFEKKINSILNTAFDCGIRHFDTARLYGLGEAECKIGQVIKCWPEKVLISTKFGLQFHEPNYLRKKIFLLGRLCKTFLPKSTKGIVEKLAPIQFHDFSLKATQKSFEKSLKCLNVDIIDYLFLHEPYFNSIIPEDTLRFLEDLIVKGKIGAFGGSGDLADLNAIQEQKNIKFLALQFPTNYISKISSDFYGPKFAFNVVKQPLNFYFTKKKNVRSQFPESFIVAALLNERLAAGGVTKVLFNTSRPQVLKDVLSLFSTPFNSTAFLQEVFFDA